MATADPHREQERILPRLRRLLDVVSSWADPAPDAPGLDAPDVMKAATEAAVDAAVKTAAAADAAPRPLAGDGDGGMDSAHGSPAGSTRRHTRATEPIWHLVTGQDAHVPPGLPPESAPVLHGAAPPAPGTRPGDQAPAAGGAPAGHAPGAPAGAHAGEPITTAVGIGHVSGNRPARPAPGAADTASDNAAAPAAALPGQDAAVLQPLLGQETPPLFGRATPPGRAAAGTDTGARAPLPVAGQSSTRATTAPGTLLHPPDLIGDAGREPAWPTPRAVPAPPPPNRPSPAAADAAGADRAAGLLADHASGAGEPAGEPVPGRAFGRSELEEELADVLEVAAREAGVDLS